LGLGLVFLIFFRKETEKIFSDNAPAGGDVQLSYEPWQISISKNLAVLLVMVEGIPNNQLIFKDIPPFFTGFQ